MTSHNLVKRAPSRLYRKRDGIGQTPCSYERYLVSIIFLAVNDGVPSRRGRAPWMRSLFKRLGVTNTLLRELKAAPSSFTRANYEYSSPGLYAVIGCKKNNANEGCNSCASLAGLVLLQLLVVAAKI